MSSDSASSVQCPEFQRLCHLDFDWGPLSSRSWRRLAQSTPRLKTLKAVLSDGKQLELVAELWPQLQTLKLNHRSRVSAASLLHTLPFMNNLRAFHWKPCNCVQHLFCDVEELRNVEATLISRLGDEVTLPWKWTFDGNLVFHGACDQARFKTLLLELQSSLEYNEPELIEITVERQKEQIELLMNQLQDLKEKMKYWKANQQFIKTLEQSSVVAYGFQKYIIK